MCVVEDPMITRYFGLNSYHLLMERKYNANYEGSYTTHTVLLLFCSVLKCSIMICEYVYIYMCCKESEDY